MILGWRGGGTEGRAGHTPNGGRTRRVSELRRSPPPTDGRSGAVLSPSSLPHTHSHPGNAAAAAEFARVSAAAEALLARVGGAGPRHPFASGPAGGPAAAAGQAPFSPVGAAAEAALRSRRFSLAFSGACLVGGVAIFAGALRVHTAVFGPDPVAAEAAARREDPPEAVARVQEAVAAALAERAREREGARRR